jgi:N-hydroxyarylamine O-acetyltransferase
MFEELYAPLPDPAAYLARIGLAGAQTAPTAAWLDRLVHAQLTHIPFDDLDVWARGDCPSLGIVDLFEKIVVRRRGGYCFELNSLFCAFLRALGYDACPVIVCIVQDRDCIPPPAHCAVLCTLAGARYFCDVGYGGRVPDGAVKLDCGVHHGYRVGREGDFFLLERATDAGAERIMLFRDTPALPVELLPLNYHVSQRPDSVFRRVPMLNLRLPDGSVTVQGDAFRCHTAAQRIERTIADADELRALLPRYFGIPADAPPLRAIEHERAP